ncbi:MAG: putative peroxidase-related enzyme, partial [Frankiales bacterium]|nr:putative peroxidase-related enzyme [Frankiales bacterium]
VKLSRTPELVDDADHQALHDAGWDDDAVWDISAVTAFFALSNRMAHALTMRANPEFHTMGR